MKCSKTCLIDSLTECTLSHYSIKNIYRVMRETYSTISWNLKWGRGGGGEGSVQPSRLWGSEIRLGVCVCRVLFRNLSWERETSMFGVDVEGIYST